MCQVSSPPTLSSGYYYGNRGLSTIIDSGVYYTTLTNLLTAQPSASAQYSEINRAQIEATGPVTVWLRGFIAPAKTSPYELRLIANGNALLYVRGQLVASTYNATSKQATIQMNGGELLVK